MLRQEKDKLDLETTEILKTVALYKTEVIA
jgi:hypothetical protein